MTTLVTVRTVDDLERSAINTYRAGLIRRGVSPDVATKAVGKGTPIQLQIRAYAEMMGMVYANERALEDAQMPDTAMGEDLERVAGAYGVFAEEGAGAAGDVVVTCSGSVTYVEGLELVAKSGKRYQVVSTTVAASGDSVGVIGIDIGKATNLPAGEVLTWVSPPSGSGATCTVGIAGLINGQEPDNTARLRQRLVKRIRNPSGGENWPQLREWAEKASAGVEAAFVYPAVHGPATQHVAITIEGTAENGYVREAPDALLAVVRSAVLAKATDSIDTFVSGCAHQALSLEVKLSLPATIASGGPGGGWLDTTPWPAAPVVTLTSILTTSSFIVDATTAPAAGKRIAIWDPVAMAFRHATVASFSGGFGAYTIVTTLPVEGLTVGAYLCPDAEGLDDYARLVCEQVATLGPGQRTFNSGRQQRQPLVTDEPRAAVRPVLLAPLLTRSEVASASFSHVNGATGVVSLLPTAQTALNMPPKIWRIAQLGFFP